MIERKCQTKIEIYIEVIDRQTPTIKKCGIPKQPLVHRLHTANTCTRCWKRVLNITAAEVKNLFVHVHPINDLVEFLSLSVN